jgi:hypothetical protein
MKANRIFNTLLIVILCMSCKKEDNPPTIVIPTVTTTTISAITIASAISGGSVTSDGGGALLAWGVCWSTSANPTVANSCLQNNQISRGFTSAIIGLTLNTTYYVRAYAINTAGTAYGNELSFSTAKNAFIGQSYQGGKIAYILQSGDIGYDATMQHGLIAAPNDQSTGAKWGCAGYSITEGMCDGEWYGCGRSNTNGIINSCPEAGIAAVICGDLVLGGYSDWFLPSRDELFKMYLNKFAIGGFANDYYWSSSEHDDDGGNGEYDGIYAWWVRFSTGGQGWGDKNAPDFVRAARYF